MLHYAKSDAPEPYRTGALVVLYQVAIRVRMDAATMPTEQIVDLMDAVHNIPASLTEYGSYFDEADIREYLKHYDNKWARDENSFSLVTLLDGAMDNVRAWLARDSGM